MTLHVSNFLGEWLIQQPPPRQPHRTTSGLPQGITNTTALSNSAIISTPAIATSAIHRLSITNRTTHEFVLDDIKSIYIQNEGSGYREELNISQNLKKLDHHYIF